MLKNKTKNFSTGKPMQQSLRAGAPVSLLI